MITGLVLSGGESKRMGRDKAFLEVNGKPLLQIQIERLEAAGCSEILVSGPQGRTYEQFGKPVISDAVSDCGPLAGLCVGLEAASGCQVFVVAVDLPHLTSEFLRWLMEKGKEGGSVCMSTLSPGLSVGATHASPVRVVEKKYEPLCAIYEREIGLSIARQHLEIRELSLQKFVQALVDQGAMEVFLPSEWQVWGTDILKNWNEHS
jgi:molybdopterin-guanine dinucleotide biosynthesis protein A